MLGEERELLVEPWMRLTLTGDGLFYVVLSEHPSATVQGVLEAIQPHLEAHAPVRYLVDVSAVEDLPLSERWALSRRMAANRRFIRASAVVGLPKAREFMFNVIVRASARRDVRAFKDLDSARRWLKSQ